MKRFIFILFVVGCSPEPAKAVVLDIDLGSEPPDQSLVADLVTKDGPTDPCSAGSQVFDDQELHRIELQLSDEDWESMHAERASSPEYGGPPKTYFSASMTLDGALLPDPVGLRLKGHFSLITSIGHQYPMKVDFNRVIDTQKFEGLGKLNLHPSGDEGSINEFLSYGTLRAAGIPTARVSLATLSVNGEELGTYSIVEQIDGRWVRCNYPEPWGQLYKPEEGQGNLSNYGSSFSDYPTVEHKWPKTADHTSFLNMIEVINGGDISRFSEVLDPVGVMTYFAANNAVGSPDTYASTGHNYYLYEVEPGKFTMIPWDLNISQFDASDACGIAGRNGPSFPLSYYPLGDPDYVSQYKTALLSILSGAGSLQSLDARTEILVDLLERAGDVDSRATTDEIRTRYESRVDGLMVSVPNLTTCP